MIIVLDFDGVLCEDRKFEGHDKFGEPNKEWIDAVRRWHSWGHRLKLDTTRLNPYPFGRMGKRDEQVVDGTAYRHLTQWLFVQRILHCFEEVGGGKSYGDFYVDNRFSGFPEWPPERIERHYKLKPEARE